MLRPPSLPQTYLVGGRPRTSRIDSRPLAQFSDPRTCLPSTVITCPVVNPVIAWTHAMNLRRTACGSSMAKTRPHVVCEGMPLGSSRHCFSRLLFTNNTTSRQRFAPHITVPMASTTMSIRVCRCAFPTRGSQRLLQYRSMVASG
jgi:hypothetical protein